MKILAKEKLNCWQLKKCGREKGRKAAHDCGACPASTAVSLNGTNGGINAGRSCWSVAGTLCCRKIEGTYSSKLEGCIGCEVFMRIMDEEGLDYIEMFRKNSMLKAFHRKH